MPVRHARTRALVTCLRKIAAESPHLRHRVNVILKDGRGRILITPDPMRDGAYGFHGGGVEAGETPHIAAKRESLEEVGHDVRDLRTLGSPITRRWTADEHAEYRRTGSSRARYAGVVEHWVCGRSAGENRSLYGSAGDALVGSRFVSVEEAHRLLRDSPQARVALCHADDVKKLPRWVRGSPAELAQMHASIQAGELHPADLVGSRHDSLASGQGRVQGLKRL